MDTAMLQIPQVLPSAIQPKPPSPHLTPQLFLMRQPNPLLKPTITTAWSSRLLQSLKMPLSQNCRLQPAMPAETGPRERLLMTALQSPSAMELKEVSLKEPPSCWHLPVLPVFAEVQGQAWSEVTPLSWMQVKAPSRQPPLQPKVRPLVLQSMTCCTERETKKLNLFMAFIAARVSTAVKAQHAPQKPWYLIAPAQMLQSISTLPPSSSPHLPSSEPPYEPEPEINSRCSLLFKSALSSPAVCSISEMLVVPCTFLSAYLLRLQWWESLCLEEELAARGSPSLSR